MPTLKKKQAVEELNEKIKKAQILVLTDYQGLKVNQQEELRKRLKAAGASYVVAKNTLIKISLKSQNLAYKDSAFRGATAILFGWEDQIPPVKVLKDFYKENKLPEIKGGFLGNEWIDTERINQLAQLPDRQVLLSHLAAQVSAPITGFMSVLLGNTKKLVWVLEAIKKQKN